MIGTGVHALATAIAQIIVWYFFGDAVVGGALGVAYYLGREMSQAEYRAIGTGKREDMDWYAAYDPKNWTTKGALDVLVPLAVCIGLAWLL